MQGQSYQVKNVLGQYDATTKTFLAFKESPGNPLSRSPRILLVRAACEFFKLCGAKHERSVPVQISAVRNLLKSTPHHQMLYIPDIPSGLRLRPSSDDGQTQIKQRLYILIWHPKLNKTLV